MRIPNDELTKWRDNVHIRNMRDKLYEVYQIATCCNGPYPNPNDRDIVYKEFNKFAWKLFNNRIKKK